MREGMAGEAEKRRARLAAELRENLKRRKAQQRGRRDAAPGDETLAEAPPGEEPGEPPTSAT